MKSCVHEYGMNAKHGMLKLFHAGVWEKACCLRERSFCSGASCDTIGIVFYF